MCGQTLFFVLPSKSARLSAQSQMPARPPSVLTHALRRCIADASRAASTSAAGASTAAPDAPAAVVYEGPLSTTVTRLKRVSLLSCVLTTASAPALATLDAVGGAAVHPAAQTGIAAAVATFGVFTTGVCVCVCVV